MSVFGLTGRFQSGKLRPSRTFTGCFLPVIRDLFYESDLTQWSFFLCPWDRDTEQSECLIALFYSLYEYFMYFGPACGFWSETQRKKENISRCVCVCEREREHMLDPVIPHCLVKVTCSFFLMFYVVFSHRLTQNMVISPVLQYNYGYT